MEARMTIAEIINEVIAYGDETGNALNTRELLSRAILMDREQAAMEPIRQALFHAWEATARGDESGDQDGWDLVDEILRLFDVTPKECQEVRQ